MGWYEEGAKRLAEAMKEKERWSINSDNSLTPLNDNARHTVWAYKIKKTSKKIKVNGI